MKVKWEGQCDGDWQTERNSRLLSSSLLDCLPHCFSSFLHHICFSLHFHLFLGSLFLSILFLLHLQFFSLSDFLFFILYTAFLTCLFIPVCSSLPFPSVIFLFFFIYSHYFQPTLRFLRTRHSHSSPLSFLPPTLSFFPSLPLSFWVHVFFLFLPVKLKSSRVMSDTL